MELARSCCDHLHLQARRGYIFLFNYEFVWSLNGSLFHLFSFLSSCSIWWPTLNDGLIFIIGSGQLLLKDRTRGSWWRRVHSHERFMAENRRTVEGGIARERNMMALKVYHGPSLSVMCEESVGDWPALKLTGAAVWTDTSRVEICFPFC